MNLVEFFFIDDTEPWVRYDNGVCINTQEDDTEGFDGYTFKGGLPIPNGRKYLCTRGFTMAWEK